MKATPHVYVSDRVSRRDFLKLSSLVAGMGGVMVLSGCGPAAQEPTTDDASDAADDAADTAATTLGDGKTLRVGMEAAYAPYNWQATEASDTTIPIENVEGAYADGYDVQIAKRIAEELGMEPVAVKMDFGALVDSLNNGTIDIICAGMSVTPERAESADFTDSYIDDEVIIVVKKDSESTTRSSSSSRRTATTPTPPSSPTSPAPPSSARRTPSTMTSSRRSPTSTT